MGDTRKKLDKDLRKLITEAGYGEPCRDAQPSDGQLKSVKNAKKHQTLPAALSPSAKEIAKDWHDRPLPNLLVDAVRRLWAYVLHQQMSPADALNILFNIGRVASDSRFDEHTAALASVHFFHSTLEQSWRESRRGGSEEERRASISHSFFEFDKAEAKQLLEDQADLLQGPAKKSPGAVVDSSGGAKTKNYCARFLLSSCTNPRCGFKHDCPFCPAPEDRAQNCCRARLRNFGWEQKSRQDLRANGAGSGQATEARREEEPAAHAHSSRHGRYGSRGGKGGGG